MAPNRGDCRAGSISRRKLAYFERGTLRLLTGDRPGAIADLDAALHLAEGQSRHLLASRAGLVLATVELTEGATARARERYATLAREGGVAPFIARRARLGLALCEGDLAERDSRIIAVLEEDGPEVPAIFCDAVSTPFDRSLAELLTTRFGMHPMARVERGAYEAREGHADLARESYAAARELSRAGAAHARWGALVDLRLGER